jgi:hypothetical protein
MDRQAVASELVRVARLVAGYTFPRSFHIPKDAVPVKDVGGTDLEIWVYEGMNLRMNKPYYGGIAFAGKQSKPLWHYTFRDEANRQKQIQDTIESRQKSLAFKKQQLEERRKFRHSLKVDDILYDSWGYDQTNIDFYQVIEVGEKSVKIRPIASKPAGSSGDHVVAVPGHFTGPAQVKIVGQGNSVRVESGRASVWDGHPLYETPAGYGH